MTREQIGRIGMAVALVCLALSAVAGAIERHHRQERMMEMKQKIDTLQERINELKSRIRPR